MNPREFNEQWAYRPFLISGRFDHDKEVLVERNKDGESGYQVVTPFYCYTGNNGEEQALLVDRGWVPYDWSDTAKHRTPVGNTVITGVLYRGDSSNKYSKENAPRYEKWRTINPEEISIYVGLNNKEVAKQAIVKQIDFDSVNKTMFPKVMSKDDLFRWTISPEDHKKYSKFWMAATFVNIFSNLYVWLYL